MSQKLSFGLALIIMFAGGYLAGRQGWVARRGSVELLPVIEKDTGRPAAVDFGLFWEAWDKVDQNYVKTPDNLERLYGAIAGMVSGTGDPFSVYMKPSENVRFAEDISGNFEGIGAELIQKDGYITVVAPLDASPAYLAGLQAGDIVVKIDDQDAPTVVDDAVNKIRGDKGTTVKLTVARDGKLRDISIVRDRVEIKSVTYRQQDAVGIVKINQFNANTTALLDKQLRQAESDKVTGLVLDVRNNPGGLLNVAVDITSRFIDPGVVLIERDKRQQNQEIKTSAVTKRVTLPLAVLVNKGSASASEIFAGALQDHARAKIIGETTFGKGSVQAVETLSDGSAIRLTIAEWLTPDHHEINKVGIKPDIEVKLTDGIVPADGDPQLMKALELLSARSSG